MTARPLTCAVLLALAGCAGVPPPHPGQAAPAYQTDLSACREFGAKEAHRRVMASGGLFLTYPVSLPIQRRIQVRRCMEAKGYVES